MLYGIGGVLNFDRVRHMRSFAPPKAHGIAKIIGQFVGR